MTICAGRDKANHRLIKKSNDEPCQTPRENKTRIIKHEISVLRKRIKTVSLLSVGEGHPHARGERGVKNDSRALVSGCQVHRGHRANALSIQNNILWADAISVREREN